MSEAVWHAVCIPRSPPMVAPRHWCRAMPALCEVLLPSGTLVPGVLLKSHILELGPAHSLGIGERVRIDGREATVVGHLRGRRRAVEGLWEAGRGRQMVLHWSDEPVR